EGDKVAAHEDRGWFHVEPPAITEASLLVGALAGLGAACLAFGFLGLGFLLGDFLLGLCLLLLRAAFALHRVLAEERAGGFLHATLHVLDGTLEAFLLLVPVRHPNLLRLTSCLVAPSAAREAYRVNRAWS